MTDKLEVTVSCGKLSSTFTKKINVTTNDPSNPSVVLTYKGKILEPIKMSPNYLNFGQVARKSGPVTKSILLTPGDGGPLDPKLRPTKAKNIEARLTELKKGEEYELEVTVTPPFESQRLNARLELETGIAKAPTMKVRISGSMPPRVVATPRRFTVPRDVSAGWEQTVTLSWDDNKPYKIISATINDPTIALKVEEVSGMQRIVMRLPAGYSPRRGAQNVLVKTDDPETPNFSVPITVARPVKSRGATRPHTPATGKVEAAKPTKRRTTGTEAWGGPKRTFKRESVWRSDAPGRQKEEPATKNKTTKTP
ncbi:MAG: hypothetical protein JSU63_03405 [Phycisphaerales bacterium]|nr:MAG: hypothetical protein JSU63_03405 [Phycisphaerales bacterium]